MATEFYDGTKLLSLKDLNGKEPEIYICTSNRQAGKTTYFSRLLVNKYLRGNGKFVLLYRNINEIADVANKFFSDIQRLFFPDYVMTSKTMMKGKMAELFLTKDGGKAMSCGYAVSLRAAGKLKQYAHLLSDANSMLFDEFQPEDNSYLPNELDMFISLHTSIARGNGQQARYLPVYMVSNAVTIINPYYTSLGIAERLTKDTHFLRGDGFVMEAAHIESAASALKNSGFARAFKDSHYMQYALQNVYLNDNEAFIERPHGSAHYMFTLAFDSKKYSVWQYPDICYVSDRFDPTFPVRIAAAVGDHDVNYQLIGRAGILTYQCRRVFEAGGFRFKNLDCKRALMNLISY